MAALSPAAVCTAIALTLAVMSVVHLIQMRRRFRVDVETAALDLWNAGDDTAQIAATLGISEAMAANALSRARDRQRSAAQGGA